MKRLIAVLFIVLLLAGTATATAGLQLSAPDRTATPGATVEIPVTASNDGNESYIVGMQFDPDDPLQIVDVSGDGTYYPNKSTILYLSPFGPDDTLEQTVSVELPDQAGATYDLTVELLPAEGPTVEETVTITVPSEETTTPSPTAAGDTVSFFGFEIDLPDLSEWFG